MPKNVTLKFIWDETPSREEAAKRLVAGQIRQMDRGKDWPKQDLAFFRDLCCECSGPYWVQYGERREYCDACQVKEDLLIEEQRHHQQVQMDLDKARLAELRGKKNFTEIPVEVVGNHDDEPDVEESLMGIIGRGFSRLREESASLIELINDANERHQDD